MKNLLTAFGFFSLFLFSNQTIQAQTACASPVIAYDETRFCGDRIVLEGNWSVRHHRSYWNDRIASLQIPYGWEVWIYEHRDFRGERLILRGDWNIHNNPWWRNRISSIRVVRAENHHDYHHHHDDHHGAGITIYEDGGYRGEALTIYADWTAHDRYDFWNDKISSIHVPPGYALVLYEHANFRGRSVVLEHTWTVNRASDFWNDRVSSIKVLRR